MNTLIVLTRVTTSCGLCLFEGCSTGKDAMVSEMLDLDYNFVCLPLCVVSLK